jgi:lysyl-tRNA synthetase class 2
MALSEQEIIRREKLQSLRNLGSILIPPNLFNSYFKAGQATFEDGKTVALLGR